MGFVPLCDCAPLVMAQELGLFEKHGLRVHLSREVGWATVRDKIIYGELDAAHALAPMVFAASLGLGSAQVDCLTGLVLSVNGNAITLVQSLYEAASLRELVRERHRPLVFGVPFLHSSHLFLLRAWLRSQELNMDRDVQLVVTPPPQMPSNLKAGHLDGYCVGEPWNSVARLAGFGWRAATSDTIAPQHPEKVLMVRGDFAETRTADHHGLIAALYDACQFCARPENHERVIETLGEPRYVNAPAAALREGCEFTLQHAISGPGAFEPSPNRATWVLEHLRESGLLAGNTPVPDDIGGRVFRADIFRTAIQSNRQVPAEVKTSNLPQPAS